MNGEDLVATAVQQRFVPNRKLTRARMAGADDGPWPRREHRVELVGVEVDAFQIVEFVDRHGGRHDFDLISLHKYGGQGRGRVGADPDHEPKSTSHSGRRAGLPAELTHP